MARIVPLSRQDHGGKGWQKTTAYGFASKDIAVPIVVAELGAAALAMPIAFVKHANGFVLAGVTGLENGVNLFVAPDGRWIGGYIPVAWRSYPFRVANIEGQTQVALCIDEDSGLLREASEGEPFFAGEELAPAVRKVFDVLLQTEQFRVVTARAVAALADAAVLEPWIFDARMGQTDKKIQGLWRVNEKALNALDDAAFLKLRQTGAIAIAYSHLVSLGQVRTLELLYRAHEQHSLAANKLQNLPGEFMLDAVSDELVFDAETLAKLKE